MVDFYHLFKLGVSAGKVLKASKGAYNAGMILKSVWKPMAVMGLSGVADAAIDEGVNKATNYILNNQDTFIEAVKVIKEETE